MKKILLLATGGTIASQPTASGLVPRLAPQNLLRYVPRIDDICTLKSEQLFCLDSSNIQPGHWQQMARRIYQALPHADGVVLCHGTDTMAYTAAALFTMLPGLDKPVVLTGSQLPLEADHTDAIKNLEDAFSVCASGLFPGVTLVFDGEIISGACAYKIHTTDPHGFTSINLPGIGTVKNGIIHMNDERKPPRSVPEDSRQTVQLKDRLEPRIFLLKLIPGMDGKILDHLRALDYAGIVIEGFGAGGIPCLDDSFPEGIRRCTSQGIPVVITTQCAQGAADLSLYEVGVRAAEAGAVCGQGLSTEMLCIRLMWALGQTRDLDQVKRLLFPLAI